LFGLNGVLAVETGKTEAVFFKACGVKHPGEAQVAEAVQAEKVLDLIDGMLRGNELSPGWKIDAIVAGMPVRGAAYQHMDLPGPRFPQGLDPQPACGAPYDRVLNNHHPLLVQDLLDGIELYLHPKIPHGLGRLNKGPADIVVPDNPHLKGYAGFLTEADGCVGSGIGEGHGKICLDRVFLGQFLSEPLSHRIHVLPEDGAVRPGKVDVLKDAKASPLLRKRPYRFQAVF